MMTSHQLARKLLDKPDSFIVVSNNGCEAGIIDVKEKPIHPSGIGTHLVLITDRQGCLCDNCVHKSSPIDSCPCNKCNNGQYYEAFYTKFVPTKRI